MTNPANNPANEIAPPEVDMTPKPRPQTSGGNGGTYGKYTKPGVYTFYKLRQMGEVEPSKFNYQITKFNSDLDIESQYNMTFIPSRDGGYYDCNCPASKFDCRHKSIMRTIRDAGKVDSEHFYCFETKTFKLPTEIA